MKGISFGCSRIELSGLITLSYIILHHFLCLGLKNYKLAKRENFSKRLLFTKSSAHCKIHLHINGNKLQRRRAVVFPVYLNTIRFNIYQFISSVLRFNVIFCLFSLFYSSFWSSFSIICWADCLNYFLCMLSIGHVSFCT